jgi:hypothetical protein
MTIGTGRTLTGSGNWPFVNAAGGTIQGSGTLNAAVFAFTNAGALSPGVSPGILTFTGNVPEDSSGVVNIEIGGLTPGTQFDRLDITGNATLNGTLNVSLINSFFPSPGDTFRIINYGSHTGVFRFLNGLSLGSDLYFIPHYPGFSSGGVTLLTVRQAWDQLSPTGGPPDARSGHASAYDAGNNRMIVFAGLSNSGPLNDVWVLTDANGTGGTAAWSQLAPSGGPPAARQGHSASYDPVTNTLIVFGGDDASSTTPVLFDDVWALSNANGLGGSPAWTQLAPTGTPGARTQHSAAYSSASNRLIVFGGDLASGSCLAAANDVWVLTRANGSGGSPAWSPSAPSGAPPEARRLHSAVYDAAGNRMTVFGGDNPCSSLHSDAWVLTAADGSSGTPAWALLGLSNNPPPVRRGHTGIYDASVNRMTVFGGQGSDGSTLSNEALLFPFANNVGGTPSWTILPPPTMQPAARHLHTSVYDAANRRMTVFGGATASGRQNDVWVLTITGGNGEVSSVPPATPPEGSRPIAAGFTRRPSPNPTREALAFAIAVSRDQDVDLSVHDVVGRLVTVVYRGGLKKGEHAFHWTAKDSNGSRAAGIYFLRFRSEELSRTVRFVVAK